MMPAAMSESKYAKTAQGLLDRVKSDGLPAEPTKAIPGTEEKIAVLTARAAACLDLHHDEDVTI